MVSAARPRLVFVSPIFLFPADAGGKIRSTNILRGLKGGCFHVTLMSPAAPGQAEHHAADLDAVCDAFLPWRATPKPRWLRAFDLLKDLPVNVAADLTRPAQAAVRSALTADACEMVVFDFVHAAVLRPPALDCANICFTHNVEAEIFARHAEQATNRFLRRLWSSQHAKMLRFEAAALASFTSVIAVSERDAQFFRSNYGLRDVRAIPTGVDLDFFSWQPPLPVSEAHPPTVIFTGSMNSAANIGGVKFFIESVWPLVQAGRPDARFVVVGRDPPASLVSLGQSARRVSFTGMVDDVRPHVRSGHVSVIPLLVGGGTRIKAFEAMAMGSPLVSTSVGIEGLDVEADTHYLCRDDPQSMAAAVLELLGDQGRRSALSSAARAVVEDRFGHRVAARAFERICVETMETHRRRRAS